MSGSTVLSRTAMKETAHEGVVLQAKNAILFFLVAALFSYVAAFLAGALLGFILPFLAPIAGLLGIIFLGNVVSCSQHVAGVRLFRDRDLDVGNVFDGFHSYWHIVGGMLWYSIRTFLWLLVPVIGVKKLYAYSLTPYLLFYYPDLSAEEAIQRSKNLTEGHKMELFSLDLSFAGWLLLSVTSAGILGIAYIFPYYYATWGGYYLALDKKEASRTWREKGTMPPPPSWYCPNCGAANSADTAVCESCGHPLGGKHSDSVVTTSSDSPFKRARL